MMTPVPRRVRLAPTLAAAALAAGLAVVGVLTASDHQDSLLVELTPRYDVNDVYAFPAPTPGRIVLVLGTTSPITPAQTPASAFGDNQDVLYQLKVDNTGDAVEDLVFQMTFTGPAHNQKITLEGPTAPNQIGVRNTLIKGKRTLHGSTRQMLGSADGIRLFAGPRDDPFFIDLEQFFRILPDRRPETGPLSMINPMPPDASFRAEGSAVDFLRGINDLAIVIELPVAMLTNDGQRPRFGVWGTTSRRQRGS